MMKTLFPLLSLLMVLISPAQAEGTVPVPLCSRLEVVSLGKTITALQVNGSTVAQMQNLQLNHQPFQGGTKILARPLSNGEPAVGPCREGHASTLVIELNTKTLVLDRIALGTYDTLMLSPNLVSPHALTGEIIPPQEERQAVAILPDGSLLRNGNGGGWHP